MTSETATTEPPLVSCVMPTCDRRRFVPQAIEYFRRQDYPNRELLVVDDGCTPVADLLPEEPSIRYIRLARKETLGEKRNVGCGAANGEIVILWDDDDWYSSNRISYQIEPLVKRQASVTGLGKGLLLSLESATFWAMTDRLHDRMFFRGIVSGTMAFWKRLWTEGARFPNISLADDATFLRRLVERGIRLHKLENTGIFVYIRHGGNTWKFAAGEFLDRQGWQAVEPPAFVGTEDLEFYGVRREVGLAADSVRPRRHLGARPTAEAKPLVSCVLGTRDRRLFLGQAIKYFQKQSYENRELIIVDDGAGSGEQCSAGDERIRYIRLDAPATLGTKLNVAVERARGQIIQKIDDDDYYHPTFLATTVASLLGHDPNRSIVGFDSFLVLISATGELKFSGTGWCAGGTLCFYRQLWEKRPFRDVPSAVDWWFLKDNAPQRIAVREPELYIIVRHDGEQLWKRIGELDVTEYFRRCPDYHKKLGELLPEEDLRFYERLLRKR